MCTFQNAAPQKKEYTRKIQTEVKTVQYAERMAVVYCVRHNQTQEESQTLAKGSEDETYEKKNFTQVHLGVCPRPV